MELRVDSHGYVPLSSFLHTIKCILRLFGTISMCPLRSMNLSLRISLDMTCHAHLPSWSSVSASCSRDDRPFRRDEKFAQIFRNDKNFLSCFLHICILLPPLCQVVRYRHRDLSRLSFPLRTVFLYFGIFFRFRRIYIVSRLNISPCFRCKCEYRNNVVDTLNVEIFTQQ